MAFAGIPFDKYKGGKVGTMTLGAAEPRLTDCAQGIHIECFEFLNVVKNSSNNFFLSYSVTPAKVKAGKAYLALIKESSSDTGLQSEYMKIKKQINGNESYKVVNAASFASKQSLAPDSKVKPAPETLTTAFIVFEFDAAKKEDAVKSLGEIFGKI